MGSEGGVAVMILEGFLYRVTMGELADVVKVGFELGKR